MQGMKSSISKAEYYYSAVEIYIQSVSSNIRYVEGGINTLGFLASGNLAGCSFFYNSVRKTKATHSIELCIWRIEIHRWTRTRVATLHKSTLKLEWEHPESCTVKFEHIIKFVRCDLTCITLVQFAHMNFHLETSKCSCIHFNV